MTAWRELLQTKSRKYPEKSNTEVVEFGGYSLTITTTKKIFLFLYDDVCIMYRGDVVKRYIHVAMTHDVKVYNLQ